MQTKSDFEAQLNSVFSIHHDEGSIKLTLIDVSGVTAEKVENGKVEPFSAVFRADDMDAYHQGVYTLSHDSVGDITLFLVPIGPDDNGMRYEAIFT